MEFEAAITLYKSGGGRGEREEGVKWKGRRGGVGQRGEMVESGGVGEGGELDRRWNGR